MKIKILKALKKNGKILIKAKQRKKMSKIYE